MPCGALWGGLVGPAASSPVALLLLPEQTGYVI
jgi:hypothetical protein